MSSTTNNTDAENQDAAVASQETKQQQQQEEEWQVQRDVYKHLGSDAYRQQDFGEAVRQYSNALTLDPTNHVLLSNRSAAHLKLSNKSKALQDAKACVEHMPSQFSKGHSRLGAALQSLGRWQAAKEAYQQVLALEKDNVAAIKGMEDCNKQLKAAAVAKKEAQQEEEETDPLDDFFDQVDQVSKPKPAEHEHGPSVIRQDVTDLGTAQSQMDRLLATNYKWKNLNPFFVLDIPHTSSADDISRRYKALSLLLHPDKCRDLDATRAKQAYDQVQHAKVALSNDDKARHVRQLIEQGHKQGLAEYNNDAQQNSDMTLQQVQSRAVQRLFAEIEQKRREVERRERKQEQRERTQEEDLVKKERKEREFDKNWRVDTRVDKRIGNWRDFSKKSSKKAKL